VLPLQPLHEPQDGLRLGREGVQHRRPLLGQQHSLDRRGGMLIEGDDRDRLHHDRPPLYAALLRAVASRE
jgi:hypothetical protein